MHPVVLNISAARALAALAIVFATNLVGFKAGAATISLSNPETIILPGGDPLDPGAGSVYPSTVQISGATNAISKVTVTVRNITHSWPDDIDLLLVGPGGRNVMLLSDCGLDNGASDITITFDDSAANSVPTGDPGISSGTFRPTNDGTLDDLPAPAPARPYSSSLAIFNNTIPNGTWALYAADDSPENSGYIADGWTLSITLGSPAADLAITQTGPTGPVFVGTNFTYTLTVTNRGPAVSATVLQDTLPPSQAFVSASTSRGSCAHNAGTVTCDFGNLLVGQGALITLVVAPISGATATNTATVAGNQFDINVTNNTAPFVTSSIGISDLAVAIEGPSTVVLAGQPATYSVIVTNLGPNASNGISLTNQLPTGFVVSAAVPSQGSCSSAAGTISCQLGSLNSGGAAVIQVTAQSPSSGNFTNHARVWTAGLDTAPGNDIVASALAVLPAADFAIGTPSSTTNLIQGQNFVSAFTITNRGPSAAAVVLSDPMPPGLSFISATTSHGACTNLGTSIDCGLGTLFNGESASVTITCRTLLAGVITNVATLGSPLVTDPVSANNSAAARASVTPSVDLVITTTDTPDPVWLGGDVLYRIAITNRGASAASAIQLTNSLPPNFSFVTATTAQGACADSGNQVHCNLGTLNPGAGVTVALTLRPNVIGLFSFLAFVTSAEIDPTPQNNSVMVSTRVINNSGAFGTATPISIAEFGPGNPYPSAVFVSGLTSAVFHLRVTLTNLTHSYPDDIDLLLVGPQSQSVLLMSDCGGDVPFNGVTLTFDDGADNFLPNAGPIPSGTYRPTNYEINPDTFSLPAPAGPYSTNLSAFRNTDPNGTWSLYVFDDAAKDFGAVAGGWSLDFFTQDPLADLAVSQLASANPAPLAGALLLSYTVTNRGPTTANSVRLTNTPPASLQGVNFLTSQGSCGNFGGTWICNLGSLAPGATATVNVQATPSLLGPLGNIVAVGSDEIDARTADNVSSFFITVEQPPFITLNPVSTSVTNGASAQFSAMAGGTGPLHYQWQRNGVNLPGATNSSLLLTGVAPSNSGAYRVVATNRVGSAFSAPAGLTVQGPPFISDLPNRVINENTNTGPIPFLLTDAESPSSSLNLFAGSSNPALVPVSAIVFGGGTGTNRTVTATPLPNQSGITTISVAATDPDGNATTNFFILTVNIVIDPPRFVAIERAGETVTLSLTTETGFNYAVEYKESLDDVTWIPLRSIAGTGGIVIVNDALAISQIRYYRARTE